MGRKEEENPFLTLIDDYKRGKLPKASGRGEGQARPSQRKKPKPRRGEIVVTIIPHFRLVADAYRDSHDAKLRGYAKSAMEAASQLQKVENGAKAADLRAYKRTIQANPDISITKSLVLVEPDEMPADMFVQKVKGWDALMAKELGL